MLALRQDLQRLSWHRPSRVGMKPMEYVKIRAHLGSSSCRMCSNAVWYNAASMRYRSPRADCERFSVLSKAKKRSMQEINSFLSPLALAHPSK